MPIGPHASYYDSRSRAKASLIRARRPYLVRNALTGIGIFAFTIGVYSYTIRAIGTDEFEDVVPPPLPSGVSAEHVADKR